MLFSIIIMLLLHGYTYKMCPINKAYFVSHLISFFVLLFTYFGRDYVVYLISGIDLSLERSLNETYRLKEKTYPIQLFFSYLVIWSLILTTLFSIRNICSTNAETLLKVSSIISATICFVVLLILIFVLLTT